MTSDIKKRLIFDDLVNKCVGNNRIAQKKLYELLYKPIYNLCLYMVKNQTDAEDIMQESFISAFSKIKNYNKEINFEYWIKRIAINKSIDYLRIKKRILFTDNPAFENHTEDETYFEAEKNKQYLIQKLKKNILKLPDGYRIVISLYYFEGFDHQEISKILNIKESSSRSQLNRAINKLKSLISEKDEVQA